MVDKHRHIVLYVFCTTPHSTTTPSPQIIINFSTLQPLIEYFLIWTCANYVGEFIGDQLAAERAVLRPLRFARRQFDGFGDVAHLTHLQVSQGSTYSRKESDQRDSSGEQGSTVVKLAPGK
ncbi:unnamed protein product, partial [Callosobruchus maculatus]